MMIAAFMPVLNEAERIGRAISSLQRQTHPISKLVVVDGGSTDTTHEEVEAIATETDFEIDLHVIEGAGVRYSSQFGAEKAAEHLSRLEDESHTVFGGPVKPHDPAEKPFLKRVFTLVQNAEELPKGRGMAFRASDFYAVEGYRMESEEDIQASEIDCLEDGILVSKLQERGGVAFCHDTCVYSTVPSTSATSPRRWWIAAKIEREMGPTSYFTRIASPVNKLFYLGERFVEAVHSRRQVP